MKYTYGSFCILLWTALFFNTQLLSTYIIGLMQVKNESDIIEYSLRGLAHYTDAIILLDDASEDDTLQKVQNLAKELNIIKIIANEKSEWIHGSEVNNRQKLLNTGRSYGGTHFIELDADEILSAPCAENNWLKNKLLSLKKGQILQIPLINLWKGFECYRSKFTDNYPDVSYCAIGYCDDGINDLSPNLAYSHACFIHFGRFPHKYPENYPLFVYEPNLNHSVIHLPFVNWKNVIIKKVWIIMLEIIRLQEKLYNKKRFPNGRTASDVDRFYKGFHNYDNQDIQLSAVPSSWLNYEFFKQEPFLQKISLHKLKDIREWVSKYGYNLFAESEYIQKHLPNLLIESNNYFI